MTRSPPGSSPEEGPEAKNVKPNRLNWALLGTVVLIAAGCGAPQAESATTTTTRSLAVQRAAAALNAPSTTTTTTVPTATQYTRKACVDLRRYKAWTRYTASSAFDPNAPDNDTSFVDLLHDGRRAADAIIRTQVRAVAQAFTGGFDPVKEQKAENIAYPAITAECRKSGF